MDSQELRNRFTYHPPQGNQADRYESLRDGGRKLAELINQRVPDSREKSLAITHLQDAIMWANAGIACHE